MKQIKCTKNLDATLSIPGSKSYTQRALIIASIAEGESLLQNCLISEDTKYLAKALASIGSDISINGKDMAVKGTGGNLKQAKEPLYLGNNGTALRFLTAVVSLGEDRFVLDGSSRLRERPVKPLLDALNALGVKCRGANDDGYPPVIVDGHGIKGGRATFTDTQSSQYVSAVLISAPYARGDVEVKLEGTTSSMPYIDMTIETMRTFGVDVLKKGEDTYAVGANQRYKNVNYVVESDASSASYFFLAAALCGGKVRILNMNPDTLQGDMGFIKILEQSGCRVTRGADWIEVAGGKLEPGDYDFDMSGMPDIVPTLAVLAAFRPGRTSIKNVAHLRIKESNRIEALVNELKRTGIEAKETEDGLVIEGGTPHGAEIRTYDDHRIAMSFAVAGLVTEGMKIENHECVNKSFPEFWETLDRLYK